MAEVNVGGGTSIPFDTGPSQRDSYSSSNPAPSSPQTNYQGVNSSASNSSNQAGGGEKTLRYTEDQSSSEENYKILKIQDSRAGQWGNTGIGYIDDPAMRALYVDAHNKSFGPTLKKSYEYGWSVVKTSSGKLGLTFNALDNYKSTYFSFRLGELARFHTHRSYLGPTNTDYGASWINPFTNGKISSTPEYVVDPKGVCSYKGTGFDIERLTYGGDSNYVWEW